MSVHLRMLRGVYVSATGHAVEQKWSRDMLPPSLCVCPPHSPVVVAELSPPVSAVELKSRRPLALPPSLCSMLVCPPCVILFTSLQPLSLHAWTQLCAEGEASRQHHIALHERTLAKFSTVVDESGKRGKKSGQVRKMKAVLKVEEFSEDAGDVQDDVVELSSCGNDEDGEGVLLDEEEEEEELGNDVCDEETGEEESGEEEEEVLSCSEDEGCSDADARPAKKPRGVT